MNSKNKITVNIYGSNYSIIGYDDAEYIKVVCENVDKKMKEIGENPALTALTTAILAAINISDDFYKLKNSIKESDNSLDSLQEKLKKSDTDIMVLKKENQYLKDQIKGLQAKLNLL